VYRLAQGREERCGGAWRRSARPRAASQSDDWTGSDRGREIPGAVWHLGQIEVTHSSDSGGFVDIARADVTTASTRHGLEAWLAISGPSSQLSGRDGPATIQLCSAQAQCKEFLKTSTVSAKCLTTHMHLLYNIFSIK
jgi:hypothetical protein